MKLKNLATGALSLILSFSLVEVTFALNASGAMAHGMISTSSAISEVARAKNLATVRAFIERADAQKEFERQGLSPLEASMRVASLSDFDLQKVAGDIENAPAGADVIVISLTTILLVIVILLLLHKI